MTYQLVEGDCRELVRALPDASVDAVITDPPYDLTAGKKGGTGPASVELNSPYGRARITAGAMGQKWDVTGVAFEVPLWRELLRVLKPGGHLVALGGTRTSHRMVCAVEDAGFEIRDSLDWLYGTGFPKSLNVGKSIGKAAPTVEQWDGWGTALKPAHEPIVLARKPLIGTVAENVLTHGTGALHINACRVDARQESSSCEGRWPANVIVDEAVAELLDAFRFFYVAKASRSERNAGCEQLHGQNNHPTVKPIALMRHLVRLVTPPDGLILDPFVGSGSTGCAAALEGFRFIGWDILQAYLDIARARIDYWTALRRSA